MELEHEKTLSKNYLLENEVQNLKEKLQIYDINCGNLQAVNVGISNGRKLVAWQRRLFIVLLSFLVGLVILVQFFFAVRNKPALAAVALLSLNCFMLGTLTCPILPSSAGPCLRGLWVQLIGFSVGSAFVRRPDAVLCFVFLCASQLFFSPACLVYVLPHCSSSLRYQRICCSASVEPVRGKEAVVFVLLQIFTALLDLFMKQRWSRRLRLDQCLRFISSFWYYSRFRFCLFVPSAVLPESEHMMRRLACCRRQRTKDFSVNFEEQERVMTYSGLESCILNSCSYDNESGSSGISRSDGCVVTDSLDEDATSCSSSKGAFGSFSSQCLEPRKQEEDHLLDEWEIIHSTYHPYSKGKKPITYTIHHMDVQAMKERFAKLLLGEDPSGGTKGVSTALALSNAITSLSAFV
ncbi:hypothetical protein HPP92_014664 [Vanilla planifolia]|uniref:PRONE domain-containing protein n=1 Tax=Vanilla planifolia TaxID=51239 RepID=A0A835QUX5_VANPL|nr:hypothetical protein HPP92_014664 [Vanilla planifolia]